MKDWTQLPLGTVLKTGNTYYEVVILHPDGSYSLTAIEDSHEMFIDDRIVHLGLEDGTWQIIK